MITSLWLGPVMTIYIYWYAKPVWNPYLLKDIRALESVQRRATRLVLMLKDKSYYDCLVSLNLPSLHYQRKRMDMHMDMIMTYKIIHELVNMHFLVLWVLFILWRVASW